MKINLKKVNGVLTPHAQEDKLKLDKMADGAIYEVDIKNLDLRSLQQNKAIHVFCGLISDTLNDSGLYVSDVLKVETVWSMSRVKENIFKQVVKALYNKKSTTLLNKNELNNVIDSITNALALKGVIAPEFPNKED